MESLYINSKNNEIIINYKSCENNDITLLFVHGWCIDQTYWVSQFKEFCIDYSVVSIDLPGFGKSGRNRKIWTIEEYAKDVISIIDQLNLKNVILIGHSMGGHIVLETALNCKDVIAIVGIDNFKNVGYEYSDEEREGFAGFINSLKENFSEVASNYAKEALFHSSTDSIVINRVINDFKMSDPDVAVSCIESLFEYSQKEMTKLTELKQKMFLINSDATPTDTSGLDSIGVSYIIKDVRATGHYPMIEKPEEFNRLLKQTIHEILYNSEMIN